MAVDGIQACKKKFIVYDYDGTRPTIFYANDITALKGKVTVAMKRTLDPDLYEYPSKFGIVDTHSLMKSSDGKLYAIFPDEPFEAEPTTPRPHIPSTSEIWRQVRPKFLPTDVGSFIPIVYSISNIIFKFIENKEFATFLVCILSFLCYANFIIKIVKGYSRVDGFKAIIAGLLSILYLALSSYSIVLFIKFINSMVEKTATDHCIESCGAKIKSMTTKVPT